MTKKKSVNPKKKIGTTKKKGAGRKLFDGKKETDVIRKLEEVWAIDGTDEEAAFFADISKASLSDYLKKHPAISERKHALKNKPVLKARQEVVKGLAGDHEFSLKYLERKRSKEFSTKQDLNIKADFKVTLKLPKDLDVNDI